MSSTRVPVAVWAMLAATIVASIVFAPVGLALAIAGCFYARMTAPRGLAMVFVALAILDVVLIVVVGVSLVATSGGSSSSGG